MGAGQPAERIGVAMAESHKDGDRGRNTHARRHSSFQKHPGSLEQFFRVAQKLDPLILLGDKRVRDAATDVQAVREERMRQVGNETTP